MEFSEDMKLDDECIEKLNYCISNRSKCVIKIESKLEKTRSLDLIKVNKSEEQKKPSLTELEIHFDKAISSDKYDAVINVLRQLEIGHAKEVVIDGVPDEMLKDMFTEEAKGLSMLSKTRVLKIKNTAGLSEETFRSIKLKNLESFLVAECEIDPKLFGFG